MIKRKPYTTGEWRFICKMRKEGATWPAIAEQLGRTLDGVKGFAYSHGLDLSDTPISCARGEVERAIERAPMHTWQSMPWLENYTQHSQVMMMRRVAGKIGRKLTIRMDRANVRFKVV